MALERESGLGREVIGAAMEVHRTLGPGLLEATYRQCMVQELRLRGLQVESEVVVPILYKGARLSSHYRLDLLVNDEIIVELKSVEALSPLHHSQLLTYLRLAQKPVGLLLNFNTTLLKNGIRRILLAAH